MQKLIVTHFRPDLDACAAVWLVKKYLPEFNNAGYEFVAAGYTYMGQVVDSNDDVVHVDTGLGKYDHHQSQGKSSATEKIYADFLAKKLIPLSDQEALEKIVNLVTFYDNFMEVSLPEPTSDYLDFGIVQVINGYKFINPDDNAVIELANEMLDSVLIIFKHKVQSELDVKTGFEFTVNNLKGIAFETRNNDSGHYAQKLGFDLVIRKDPKSKRGRIKARPDSKVDLTRLYEKITSIKGEENKWYLHPNKKMLLNGSSRNENYLPTDLTLRELVELTKKILYTTDTL